MSLISWECGKAVGGQQRAAGCVCRPIPEQNRGSAERRPFWQRDRSGDGDDQTRRVASVGRVPSSHFIPVRWQKTCTLRSGWGEGRRISPARQQRRQHVQTPTLLYQGQQWDRDRRQRLRLAAIHLRVRLTPVRDGIFIFHPQGSTMGQQRLSWWANQRPRSVA